MNIVIVCDRHGSSVSLYDTFVGSRGFFKKNHKNPYFFIDDGCWSRIALPLMFAKGTANLGQMLRQFVRCLLNGIGSLSQMLVQLNVKNHLAAHITQKPLRVGWHAACGK
jgi:hypothetical protein